MNLFPRNEDGQIDKSAMLSSTADFMKQVGGNFASASITIGQMEIGNAITANISNQILGTSPFIMKMFVDSPFKKSMLDASLSMSSAMVLTLLEGQMTREQKKIVTFAREAMTLAAAKQVANFLTTSQAINLIIGEDNYAKARELLLQARSL